MAEGKNLPAERAPLAAIPVKGRKKFQAKPLTEEAIESALVDKEAERVSKIHLNSSLKGVELSFTYEAVTDWGTFNVKDIVAKMELFSSKLNGVPLYEYQLELQRRIFESVLLSDGEEVTGLFSRQSGKTECLAQTCNTLLVLMPLLAGIFPEQLGRFKRGFRIGLFAPTSEQAYTTHSRMDLRLSDEDADAILSDTDVNAQKKYNNGMLQITGPDEQLPSGKIIPSYRSFCKVQSAAKQTKIESKTYDLILIDEAQEVDTLKVQKSIHPMVSSTNGTMVKIGTCTSYRSDFYDATVRNKRKYLKNGIRNHFEFDYKTCQRFNKYYKSWVVKEKERIGEDSDAFRMAFRLEWLLEKGMAITPQMYEEYLKAPGSKFEYSAQEGMTYVAGLDLGKENDSTVLTIASLEEDPTYRVDDEGNQDEKFIKTVVNWIEMIGDNWEVQFETIVEAVRNYNIKVLTVDSTGVGDVIVDRLERRLEEEDVVIIPVIFNLKEKHAMATLFYEEMRSMRIRIPSHQSASKTKRHQNFLQQFYACEKVYVKSYMQLKHGDDKDAHDDYVDSLLLMCYGVDQNLTPRARSTENFLRNSGSFKGETHRSKRFQKAMAQHKRLNAAKWRKYNG